jgi:hypothetical protein
MRGFAAIETLFRFLGLRGACLELFDAACGVDDFGLSGIERMRCGRDFYLEKRVFFPVHLVCFFGVYRRRDQKALSGGNILENYEAGIFRMNFLFHVGVLYRKRGLDASLAAYDVYLRLEIRRIAHDVVAIEGIGRFCRILPSREVAKRRQSLGGRRLRVRAVIAH